MTGSIQTKTGGKNYYAVISYYDEDGKRKQQWMNTDVPVKGNNKRKASAKLQEILAEYGEGGINPTKDVFFADYMAQHLETLKISIASSTYDGYKIILNSHILPYFKKRRLKVKDITPTIIQKYITDKMNDGLSPNTVIKHIRNISKCLDSALKQRVITYNPVKMVELPKKERFTGAKHYNENKDIQITMNIYTHLDMDAKSNIANTLNDKFQLPIAK